MDRHQSFGSFAPGALYALANVVISGALMLMIVFPPRSSRKNRWAVLAATLVIVALVGTGPRGALYTIAGIMVVLVVIAGAALIIGSRSMREVP